MVYSIDRADAVADQLEMLASGYIHQLVGHYANVDFWLDEVRHAIHVLDDYERRFRLLHAAQTKWIDDHGTAVPELCGICRGACEFGPFKPKPPKRIPPRERDDARQRLRDAAYHFLLRCHRAGFMSRAELKEACSSVGTSVDLADLR